MRAAQMRGRGAPPGLIETLFNHHSRTMVQAEPGLFPLRAIVTLNE